MTPQDKGYEGLTSLEALGIAIRQEADGADVYRELAERLGDPVVRRRFDLLAAEEDQHRAILESKWAEIAPGVPFKLPPSALPGEMCTPERRRDRSVREVLDFAIAQERRCREFYLEMSRETEDLSGQGMFRYLADMKHAHWLNLAQELDLMIRYPNYGQRGPVPWRSEPRRGAPQEDR